MCPQTSPRSGAREPRHIAAILAEYIADMLEPTPSLEAVEVFERDGGCVAEHDRKKAA